MVIPSIMDSEIILGRMKKHLRESSTDLASTSSTQSSEFYQSQQFLDSELEKIFQKMPLPVGHSAQLEKPGDYITRCDFGLPLIILRNREGALEVFANQCRHRGSKLVTETTGHFQSISCPYHGWTYDLKGQLVGAPHRECFEHLNSGQINLLKYSVAEINGLIWMKYQPQASSLSGFSDEIRGHLGELALDIAQFKLQDLKCLETEEKEVKANWKILIEGFLEGYHIPVGHRKTFGPAVIPYTFLHDPIGLHSRSAYPLRKILPLIEKSAPVEQMISGVSFVYHIFPNVIIAVEPYQFSFVQLVPIEVDRTLSRTITIANLRSLQYPEKFQMEREHLKKGLQEDYSIGESIQSNLKSGRKFSLEFGLMEGMITHFHRAIGSII